MKRVLVVATTTGYQIRSFGEAAEALGVRLVFASDRCDRLEDPWWDRSIPIRFHEEARSVDAVLAACAAAPVDGILAVGDRPAVFAARVAQALELPGHPPAAAAISRNKLATRQALQSAGLPVPAFLSVPVESHAGDVAADIRYPIVVKPLALSGSRGVVRVDTPVELEAALDRLRQLLRSRDVRSERDRAHAHVLVESFIPGDEYALEGLMHRGELQPLALIDKPDPLDGPFFEETIYRMPSTAPPVTQRRIVSAVEAACAAIGLRHGPVHAECRVDSREPDPERAPVYVLEVAARPIGGLCARALRFTHRASSVAGVQYPGEISLEELLLRQALGEDVSTCRREDLASGVMMIPIPRRGIYRGVEGVDAAKAVEGVEDVRVTAKPDTLLMPLPEGKSYLGFIFARAQDPLAVDRALREAHARLHFLIEREVAVL